MSIGKFVPLIAQVAETRIDACNFLQTSLKYYLTNNQLKLREQISHRIYASICVSATCAMIGTGDTNLSMDINQP